tara:strand:- start:35 stop:289 length:255 start_codon:yes stop_codon:yes gene_type:complete
MKIDNKILLEALLLERDRLLKKEPALLKYQLEIDDILKEIGTDFNKRMAVLNKLMLMKINEELIPAREKLKEILFNITDVDDAA